MEIFVCILFLNRKKSDYIPSRIFHVKSQESQRVVQLNGLHSCPALPCLSCVLCDKPHSTCSLRLLSLTLHTNILTPLDSTPFHLVGTPLGIGTFSFVLLLIALSRGCWPPAPLPCLPTWQWMFSSTGSILVPNPSHLPCFSRVLLSTSMAVHTVYLLYCGFHKYIQSLIGHTYMIWDLNHV